MSGFENIENKGTSKINLSESSKDVNIFYSKILKSNVPFLTMFFKKERSKSSNFIKEMNMNKTLLLAGVATALFATNANAYNLNLDITPYVSAKMAYAKLKNKSDVDSTYYYITETKYKDNVISDKTLKDDVWGTRLAYGLSAPVKFGKIRTELELGWNSKAGDDNIYGIVISDENKDNYQHEHYQANTSVWTGMFNVYYDIDTGTKLMPYINAGVGYAHLKTKLHTWGNCGPKANNYDFSFKEDANNFAWNIGLGVSYALTDNLSVDLGYRYTDFGNIKSNPTIRDTSQGDVMGVAGPFIIDGDMKFYMHEVNLGLRYAF